MEEASSPRAALTLPSTRASRRFPAANPDAAMLGLDGLLRPAASGTVSQGCGRRGGRWENVKEGRERRRHTLPAAPRRGGRRAALTRNRRGGGGAAPCPARDAPRAAGGASPRVRGRAPEVPSGFPVLAGLPPRGPAAD